MARWHPGTIPFAHSALVTQMALVFGWPKAGDLQGILERVRGRKEQPHEWNSEAWDSAATPSELPAHSVFKPRLLIDAALCGQSRHPLLLPLLIIGWDLLNPSMSSKTHLLSVS